MKSQNIVPVVLSVVVIILVAVLEKQSKLFAAFAATMPLGIPLALWIVYSSSGGRQTSGFTIQPESPIEFHPYAGICRCSMVCRAGRDETSADVINWL